MRRHLQFLLSLSDLLFFLCRFLPLFPVQMTRGTSCFSSLSFSFSSSSSSLFSSSFLCSRVFVLPFLPPRPSPVVLLFLGCFVCLFDSLPLPVNAALFALSLSHSPAPVGCLRIEDCFSEKEALRLFQEKGGNAEGEQGERGGEQSQRVSSGGRPTEGGAPEEEEEEQEKRKKEEAYQKNVRLCIERGWWSLAREIILKSHTDNVDVTSVVRKSVGEVRNHLDELIRVLNKQHHEIQVVPPAFQWAQSPVEVFLNIKFAYRWSSPGALSVTGPEFLSHPRNFTFTGVGTHSGIQKKYLLTLPLFDEINPEIASTRLGWDATRVTLQKKKMGLWDRLTEDKAKITNMNVWWDMKEKMQQDVEDFVRGNYTAKYTTASPPSVRGGEEPAEILFPSSLNESQASGGRGREEEEEESSSSSSKKDKEEL